MIIPDITHDPNSSLNDIMSQFTMLRIGFPIVELDVVACVVLLSANSVKKC